MVKKKTKSVLLYNLYPQFNWKNITDTLFTNVAHDHIYVHINIPKRNPIKALQAFFYLKKHVKVKDIYFSINMKFKGESKGFEVFRKKINFNNYEIASYTHSKGSSRKRKNTKPIKDWTKLLHYFIIERLDLSQVAFDKGYFLSGVNLKNTHLNNKDGSPLFPESKFHYSGNFVTINLKKLQKEFLNTSCRPHYYGVEVFWGTLCDKEKAYSLHQSNVNHYQNNYPESNYK